MSNHLFPEPSLFWQPAGNNEYHGKVAEILGLPSRKSVIVGVVCLPSFEAEWALYLTKHQDGGHSVVLLQADAQIWCHQGALPRAKEFTAPLQSESATLVMQAWSNMLRAVDYRSIPDHGLDGVFYHFSSWVGSSAGTLEGQHGWTWSPSPYGLAASLCELSVILKQYASAAEADRSQLLPRLLEEAHSIVAHDPTLSPSAAALREIERDIPKFVRLYERGVIAFEELARQLRLACQNAGLPPLEDMLKVVECIPPAIRAKVMSPS